MAQNEQNEQLKTKTLGNMIWRFAERCGAQGVAFVVSIILARILDPDAYGTVALLTVFISILNVFVNCGMSSALIQKKNADELDFSTVFIFNMGMCLFLYGVLFFASPLIAQFYGNSELTSLMRVLGLTVICAGFKNIQQAYVSRNLLFRKFFYSTLIGTITAAVVGIAMAYRGFGVWALVAQHVVNTAIDTCVLFVTVKWKPHLNFSKERFKGLFSYGGKLLISTLMDTFYQEIRQLVIGKVYTSTALAYYNKGRQFPQIIVSNINTSIDGVLLPVMAKMQDEKDRIKMTVRRSIRISIYTMAPMMIGLAFVAEPLISTLLTDKWLECVPYLRIFCISYMFFPIHTANLNAIKAMGRSDLFLRLEIIKKCVGIALLIVTVPFGPKMIAYGMLISSFASQIINASPNKKLINYGYFEQLKDILPGILLALFMGVCIYPISLIGLGNVLTLILQIVCGIVVFVLSSWLLKMDSFMYLLEMLKDILKKRKK